MDLTKIREEIRKEVHFNDDDFQVFAGHLKVTSLEKNQVWEQAGKISKNMGFLNKGILRQYYIKDGNEFTDSFFFEGEFVGNYISYLSKSASKLYTVAVEPCEVLSIPFVTAENLYKKLPAMERFSRIIGDKKLIELKNRSTSLLLDTPEERYYKLVEHRPDVINKIPQYLIAQYLGIRPESLSRIRKRHLS